MLIHIIHSRPEGRQKVDRGGNAMAERVEAKVGKSTIRLLALLHPQAYAGLKPQRLPRAEWLVSMGEAKMLLAFQ